MTEKALTTITTGELVTIENIPPDQHLAATYLSGGQAVVARFATVLPNAPAQS